MQMPRPEISRAAFILAKKKDYVHLLKFVSNKPNCIFVSPCTFDLRTAEKNTSKKCVTDNVVVFWVKKMCYVTKVCTPCLQSRKTLCPKTIFLGRRNVKPEEDG